MVSTPAPLSTGNKFAVAAASGMSGWLLVHPTDVVKVRLQLEGQKPAAQRFASVAELVRGLVRAEGLAGLYSGLSAALLRQLTYTTMRLGLYDVAKEKTAGVTPAPIGDQAVAAVLSGGVASFLACPVEVSLCRMQADGALPAAQRRGYAHVGDALASIARTEGAAQLFAGAAPTVARAAVVSVSQLVSYDQAKQWLGPTGVGGLREGVGLHLAASLVAGFTYSFASLPLDTAKTRMQTQVADARTGALPYASLAGTLGTIARREGAASLWRGFGPYFLRGGGHTVAMLLFKEQFTAAARRYQASHEGEAYYTYTP